MRWNRYEIGLACHRNSSGSKRSKIGLPEILVGLFPGLGGTTRVKNDGPNGCLINSIRG